MERAKKILIIFFSMSSIAGVAIGIERAMHSKLFVLQSIEVSGLSSLEDPPLSEQGIVRLMNVPVGRMSLFDLDLGAIESRLLTNDLIRSVRLQKKIPHQLAVTVSFREPRAVIQLPRGVFAYVDPDGKIFGSINLVKAPDLPLLMGLNIQSTDKIREALRLLALWENSPLHKISLISSIYWEPEKGFRVLAAYSLRAANHTRIRTMIDLGQDVDATLEGKLTRLSGVVGYLGSNSIAVRQIWADAGKKVVVKTVRGS